jgi:exoribonuclease R
MANEVIRHRALLRHIARRVMIERGLLPDYSPEALAELDRIRAASPGAEQPARDLRHLLWCSIDNDDSRDLDQLTVAEPMSTGAAKIYVAIADVDAIVKRGTAIDDSSSQGLYSLHCPESPISRPHNPTSAQGCGCWASRVL